MLSCACKNRWSDHGGKASKTAIIRRSFDLNGNGMLEEDEVLLDVVCSLQKQLPGSSGRSVDPTRPRTGNPYSKRRAGKSEAGPTSMIMEAQSSYVKELGYTLTDAL